MIQTGTVSKVKIQDVLSNQLPNYIRDESPKTLDFLKQYYISQEYQSGVTDLSDNLNKYLDFNSLTPEVIVDSSTTVGVTTVGDEIINVTSTKGFPNEYGLLKIGDEIITYTGITTNSFTGCVRGFSGITSYHSDTNKEDLVFSSSSAAEHEALSTIQNLSSLFLKEFYKKFKKTFLPGLEETDFQSDLDVGTFIGEARSLYQTKGTEESFRILFNVLYGIEPKVINLEERLIKPSFANYVRRRICVGELIEGNPVKLQGQSLLKGLTGQTLFRSDLDPNISASISEIEPFQRIDSGLSGITTYYKISLFVGYDEGSDVEGDFIVVPNSKCMENVSAGSSVITVDSTIGFGATGTLVSGNNIITYTDKTVNQFLGCTATNTNSFNDPIIAIENIRSDITYFGFEDGDTDKKVVLRLTGVLSEFEQTEKIDVEEGEIISVKSIGDKVENPVNGVDKSYKEIFANSWIYNTSSSYFVSGEDEGKLILPSVVDRSSLKEGDAIQIVDRDSNVIIFDNAVVKKVDKEIVNGIERSKLTLTNDSNFTFHSNINYKIRKKLNKAKSSGTPLEFGNDVLLSDVQNVYFKGNESYVTSNSLPSSLIPLENVSSDFSKEINISIDDVSFDLSKSSGDPAIPLQPNGAVLGGASDDQTDFSTIQFVNNHPFKTGDRIFYSATNGDTLVGLNTGVYYVEKIGGSTIQLYGSSSSIDDGKKLTFSKSLNDGIHNIVLFSQKSSVIGAQKLVKKFPLEQNISDGGDDSTPIGETGMLINGVEISNYKSSEKMFFGPLTKVDTLSGGDNFDVINLPKISVSNGIGQTALVQPVISGKVKDVFVDPQTFDIDKVISIGVTGGNGSGCVLEPVISTRFREEFFDARPSTNLGGLSTSTTGSGIGIIFFSADHKFVEGEPIIYDSGVNNPIKIGSGSSTLLNNATYFAEVPNSRNIRLYETFNDLSAGINTISFQNSDETAQGTHSFKIGLRKTLTDVRVVDEGDGYTNRKLIVKTSGISTSSDKINFVNHGFTNGDLIEYEHSGSPISGLSTSKKYFVLKQDDNSFKLADAGFDGKTVSNFDRGNFVVLNSVGSGNQIFKYPDIKAFSEFVAVGIGTTTLIDGIPISIELTPKVRGSILQTYLYDSGTGYGSTTINNHKKPIISLKNGRNAVLKPAIINGRITAVNIDFEGRDYFSTPDLEILDPTGIGAGARLRPVIGINTNTNDAIITDVIIINPGIGYSTDTTINVKSAGQNAFFDSEVRALSLNNHDTDESKDYQQLRDSNINKLKYSVTGYSTSLFGDYAGTSDKLSNIIGWAYDGNPIYGPFGSKDPTTTSTKPYVRLKSGYNADISNIEDRPVGFDQGYFLEDYKFDSSGSDLDRYNGRFEKTNEFPNGVYAYHATINDLNEPQFPYFIGDNFRSKLIEDNFNSESQSTFDFNQNGLLRNTFPYKVSDEFANNDFLVETNEIQNQKIEIESLSSGSVTDFDIIEAGQNYEIGQPLIFDETDGKGLVANISKITGKKVNKIETEIRKIDNSIVQWSEQNIVITTSENHNFETGDFVKISGLSTDISVLNNSFEIGVTTFTANTISSITASPIAGLSTEIFVSNIPTSVTIGSSIGIGTETLKILNIYGNGMLTVERDSNSSQGSTHPIGSIVNYLPNKFTINKSIPFFNTDINQEVFFNPLETVGVGTTGGTEFVRTFDFGGKEVTRNLPVKQILINNHPFKTNQKIKFSTPTGVSGEILQISADGGKNNFALPETVFVVSKDINHIGIKTTIDTPEVSITDVTNVSSIGESLRGKYKFESVLNEVTAKVERIKTNVITEENHELLTGDKISLKVEPNLSVGIGTSTDVRVIRDTVSGNILINPIGFNSTGINTTSNSINVIEHGLQTGDKVKYSSNLLPEGLENKNYFVYKVDDNNFKLSETKIDVLKEIPRIVGVASTGGSSQTISLINPNITSIKNNNLVFNLSDSSLSGYQFKIYHDNQFKNEFTSDKSSSIFSISTSGSVGSSGAKLTIGYGTSIPNILFYNLEKTGTISTTDTEVKNYSQISFLDSVYNDEYNVKVTGISSFSFFVRDIPEKLSYGSTETSSLSYTTDSRNTKGSISDIQIKFGGLNYKKLPNFAGIGSNTEGTGAVIVAKSDTIGNIEKVRIINEGFEYSSDKTLEPESLIASNVNIINTSTLGIVSVTDGGSDYITAPDIIVVNDNTGEEIKSGFLEPIMLENSILSVNVVEIPKGLPSDSVVLRTTNNTNGITITNVASNAGSSYTCRITTPPLGFSTFPFSVNDRVFVEGIVGVGTTGVVNKNTESGFNSSDYGFKLLKVSKYEEDVNGQDEVTIDLSEFSTTDNPVNTGIAETVTTTFATVIGESDYPNFFTTQEQSLFVKGETVNVSRNGIKIDGNFEIIRESIGKLKILNAEQLKIGDVLTGKNSGAQCEISEIKKNTGRLKTGFSVLKDLGWNDSIGKLNEDFQVIPDNDYYQNMSYSIQSPIEWDKLRTPVNNILHTSGMKNFADTGITSSTSATVGVTSGLNIIVDLFNEKRVDEIQNIDLVRDFEPVGGVGRFIIFKDTRLTDFVACNTNDVLIMDDISNEFTNLQANPDNFLDLFEFPTSTQTELFNNLLIVTKSNTSLFNKIEISDLMLLGDGSSNFLIQKSNLINSGVDSQNDETDNFVGYSLNKNIATDRTKLRFTPSTSPDPANNVDYDLKIISSQFNTNSVGVGTSSIGPINLTSRIQQCPSGITTNIATFPTNNFESLYAIIHVVDNFATESNLVETFVSHSNTDTFLSEKYVSSDKTSLSLNQLGIITSSVSNGNLILSYENTGSTNLKLKSKVIGIGTTGVTNGTYRFKSVGQLDGSERTALYSGVSTHNVGLSTLITLNSTLFNAVKSNVEVSIGASKAIHEVLFLHDGINAYSQQSGSLSVTKNQESEYDPSSGLGTFGATLSGTSFEIKFFPDDSVGVTTVVSFNQCFYSEIDNVNVPEDLSYGVVSESSSVVLYNSISGNRIEKTQFTPKVNSIPIFGKSFNPSDSSILNQGTGKFTIPNHFFRNNEELIYEPKSTFVGVGSTALQYKLTGVGIHTLPSRVFVVNSSKESFFISTTKAGTAVTFMSSGEGNAHEFSMVKSNEKALITIDDVAQYPLIRSNVTHQLNSNLNAQVGLSTNIVHLSGITTISTNDILKVDDELMEVVRVGFATTGGGSVGASGTFKSVEVNRGFVGTSATTHSDGSTVSRLKGSYNIVGKDLFFTKPPRGDVSKNKDINDLDIATSKFSGRVYLRNNYDSNSIYDDVSDQFTGVTSSFTLKVGGANTIGIGSTGGSGILFINGIFQSPSTDLNPNKNFKIVESGSGATGVTTVIFTGITSTDGSVFTSNNINTNQLPRGGVPISIGNTQNGLGYAPLVPAIIKPLVSVAGTIESIVGTAYSGSDLIVENAVYNGSTGIMSIRTKNEHRFKNSNDFVLIDNIGFSPSLTLKKSEFEVVSVGATNIFGISVGKTDTTFNYTGSGSTAGDVYPYFPKLTFGSGYNDIVSIGVTVQDLGYEHRFVSANTNAINVTSGSQSGSQLTPANVSYASTNGLLILRVPNHQLDTSDTITIDDASISFSCSRDNFETIHVYPRSTDPASVNTSALNNGVLPVTKIDDNTFSVNVGVNVGTGATITASVGVGGTLAFTIVGAGTDYQDPQIFVSEPSYSNLQIRGISRRGEGLTSNTGTDLRLNAIVKPITGIGSTLFEVSEYEVVNSGFAFKEGDVVEPVGLVTQRGLTNLLERSRLTIEKTYNDSFALWQFGDFDYMDSIKRFQDGKTTNFQLFINNQLISVETNETLNENVRIEDIFIVVINGVIQEPRKSYNMVGNNLISFAEPLLEEDDVTILFYKGTAGEDSIVNTKETLIIEPGDEVQISGIGTIKNQDKRTVVKLDSSKKLETNAYIGKGVNEDVFRPLSLTKQKEDKVINKVLVSKKRRSLEPRITPVSKVISDLSTSDTSLFVDSTDIFNYEGDSDTLEFVFSISKKNQINSTTAKATAIVSAAGTVTGFSTSNFGSGYTVAPTVKLSSPPVTIQADLGEIDIANPIVGVGRTATATATIGVGGTITSIVPNDEGLGYSQTNPPQVLISSPFTYPNTFEKLTNTNTLGIQTNTGVVTGIGTTIVVVGSSNKLGIKFNIKGDIIPTFEPVAVGNPIYIFDTRCGSGVTSINTSGSNSDTVGIGVSFADNIYVVAGIHTVTTNPRVGIITCLIHSGTSHAGLSSTGDVANPVGKYSVGKISGFVRGVNPISIGVTGNIVGVTTGVGISTFPTIKKIGGEETFDQTGSLAPE